MMFQERSAGAILFHNLDDNLKYLLLKYSASHWDFPKGNIEKGEEEKETVIREVKEETGISDLYFIQGFKKKISYYYRARAGLVQKEVIFYLAQGFEKHVKLSFEHKDYAWLEYKSALERITFHNSKRILDDADRTLMKIDIYRPT
jgi:8-oxo-dGTP pyrophosphatase MutT (NUDIX family)